MELGVFEIQAEVGYEPANPDCFGEISTLVVLPGTLVYSNNSPRPPSLLGQLVAFS